VSTPEPAWPEGVREIRIGDLKKLWIDGDRQLFWDGQQIEIRRPLILTGAQKLAAVLVTLFAVLGGVGGLLSGMTASADFLCARHLHWLSCPISP
jgi:hypothetical protein